MQNNDILNALSNLIQNQISKNNININIAFKNFIQKSKCTCREATIKYYNKTYQRLLLALEILKIDNLADINKVIYNKIILILKNLNYSNNSINKTCDLLKSIFKANVELEYIQSNPLAGIKKLKEEIPEIKIISKENLNLIFKYLFNLSHNFLNDRNILAILILNDTGVRINELRNIKTNNIDINNQTILLDYTKTHTKRIVFFQDLTKEYLLKYLSYRTDKCEYLFITQDNNQINNDTIYDFIYKIKKDLNIEQSISPHKWRHTFGTNLINNNVNLHSIMQVMGHTQYSTTKRYLHKNQDKLKNEILNAIKKG